MRIKLLTFLGLLSAAISLTLLFSAAPVHASGEKYKWIDPNTIEASGGLYSNVNAAKNGVLDYPRKGTGNTFQVYSSGQCNVTLTVTPSPDNTKGHLDTQGCSGPAAGFDRDFSIANPTSGPPPAGSTDNYATVVCTQKYTTAGDVARCQAIQKCVIDQSKSATDCASAYATCITNHSDAAGQATCASEVAAGDLATASATSTPASQTQVSCNVTGIGWIVCPVMRFMAQVTDQAYGVVSAMLTTPALSTDTNGAMFQAWSIMRNFANVAFVIAFLIIIYAQITGFGVTNYGVKKLLPRIIMAAILVNVSYWLCAIAIDVSNILGSSLKGLLEGASNQLFQSGKGFTSSGAGGGWDTLTVGIIAGAGAAAVLYAGLSVLAPLLLAALLAIIVVVVVLTARQALITLLVVISPLAFVAYLLPNTESWFKKWRELFQSLLLMFPIIALVFGGSKLASTILMNNNPNFILQIMAAGVTVIPLAITPILMKTTSGLLGKIGGFVNNPNRGPFDRARKGAAGYRKNRQEYRDLKAMNGYRTLPGKGIAARRSAGREAILNSRKGELKRSNSEYVAGLAENNDGFRGKLAQGGSEGANERALAQAINVQASLKADEVKASHATIMNANLDNDIESLQKLAMGGSVQYTDKNGQVRTMEAAKGSALQTAAIQSQFKIGDVAKTDELVTQSGGMGVEQRQAIAEGMQSLSGKVKYYGGSAGNTVAQGQVNSEGDLNKLVANTINDGKYSAEILAGSDKDALGRIANVAADPVGTTSQRDAGGNVVAGTATTLRTDRINELKDAVDEIATKDTIKNPDSRTQERLDAINHGVRYTP